MANPDREHPSPSDTQEFAPIRPEGVHERIEFELIGYHRLSIRQDFEHPVEIRLGRDDRTPPLFLIRYPEHGLLGGKRAVVQPDTIRRYPGRGFVERRQVRLGRGHAPEFEYGPDVSRKHCLIAEGIFGEHEEPVLEIETFGRNGVRIIVDRDDVAGELETFGPEDVPTLWGE